MKDSFHTLKTGLLLTIILFSCATHQTSEVSSNRYKEFLSKAYERGQFNGAALILKKGEIVYEGAFGLGNIDPIDSLTVNSIFRLASLSKQFTAMSIMILKESGKLSYDQDIRDFIPELPYEGVTIRNLLNHVGGLPDYIRMMNKNWKPELKAKDPERLIAGNEDIIDLFVSTKPKIIFKPGQFWEYSNTGYVLLGTIVSRASGMPFAQFLKENIFDPTNMMNTSLYKYIAGIDSTMPLRVYGHRLNMNGIDRTSTDIHYLNGAAGDGGIYSTVGDLLKWDRILYTDGLVSQETLEEAFTQVILNKGDTIDYGFGWGIGESPTGKKVVAHSGNWAGFVNFIYREIEEDNCIIILTNNSGSWNYILDPLIRILHEEPYSTPKSAIGEVIGKIIVNEGITKAIAQYKKLKSETPGKYDFAEKHLSELGYHLLQLERTENAIRIFKLNLEEFPESAEAYNSYGDALISSGDTVNALINFKTALEIDSTLTRSREKIEEIEGGSDLNTN